MKKIISLFFTASVLILGFNSANAEDVKGVDVKTLFNSDKASGVLVAVKPGATFPSTARPVRAVYYITGGEIERIYPDGKIVKKQFKAGDTAYLDKPEEMAAHAVKNVGKKEFKAYIVNIK
jgi:hypothetical protein